MANPIAASILSLHLANPSANEYSAASSGGSCNTTGAVAAAPPLLWHVGKPAGGSSPRGALDMGSPAGVEMLPGPPDHSAIIGMAC